MTGSLTPLAAALIAFVVSHFVLSSGPLRRALVGVLGEGLFRGVYALISLATFVWAIMAFQDAPLVEVWQPHMALRHLGLSIMPIACVFLVAGYTVSIPLSKGAEAPGIFKITRHPVMAAVALWGIVHFLANGDAAPMMLAGAMTVLAIGGALHIEARRADDPAWQALKAQTSFVPFAALVSKKTRLTPGQVGWLRIVGGLALFAVTAWFHEPWFGVSPLPLP